MIPFTPVGNGSQAVCDGINEWQASRPPPNDGITAVSAILFTIACILWLGSVPFFWRFRNTPRLHVVRPFTLNMLLVLSHIFFAVGAALNQAIPNLPCGLLLFSILLGVAGFGVNIFCRLLVFVVESQFATRTNQYTARLSEDDSVSVATSRKALSSILPTTKLTALASIARLALGFTKVENVPIEDLAKVRRMYTLIAFLVFAPALIPAIVMISLRPQYQQCVGCNIFLDVLLLCASAVFFYVLCIRIVFVAWRLDFPDAQGVFKEIVLITFGAGLPGLISALLLFFDPADASFNRQFAFEWLCDIAMWIFWWASVGYQFLAIYRDRKRYRFSFFTTSSFKGGSVTDPQGNSVDFIALLADNNTLYKDFEQYTIRQFAVENLYFVMDVLAYKRFFHEKASNWRKSKAKVLFETYIKPEAMMEINISNDTKERVIERFRTAVIEKSNQTSAHPEKVQDQTTPEDTETGQQQLSHEEFATMFDESVEAVTREILVDIWMRFQRDRRKSTLNPRKTLGSTMSRVGTTN